MQDRIHEGKSRVESWERMMKAVKADIWMLQEMFYDSENPASDSEGNAFRSTVRNIMNQNDWDYSWDRKGRFLLTRYPIRWDEELHHRVHATWIDLPSSVSSRDLVVINVHFKNSTTNQANSAVDLINEIKSGNHPAGIPSNVSFMVCGDFNQTKTQYAFMEFVNDNGFVDSNPSHIEANGQKNTIGSVKLDGSGNYTEIGNKQIDFVLFKSDVMTKVNAYVLNTLIMKSSDLNASGLERGDVAIEPKNANDFTNVTIACDHFPIVVDFDAGGSGSGSDPEVSFTAPANGAVYGPGASLHVIVDAVDSDGIDRVRLYKDGVELGRSEAGTPYEWGAPGQVDPELQNLPIGTYLLTARATDDLGNVGESSITVTVADDSTQVSFVKPSEDITLMEGESLEVEVSATDINEISRVYLYKDGVELARSEGTGPYEWNAPGQNDPELVDLQAGVFTLTARAVDTLGNYEETSITVNVLDPGDNLAQNGSFETGNASSWSLGSNSSVTNENSQSGTYSLKMTNGAANTRQTIALQPNTDYQLSVWVLASGLTSGGVRFDTMDKFDSPDQTPGGNCQFNINVGDAQVWTKYTGTFNSTLETSVTIRTYQSSMAGVAYFDNIQLYDLSGPPSNTAPVFNSAAVTVAEEGVNYIYNISVSDAEGDTLTLSAPTLPGWLSFNAGSALLSGNPTTSDVGPHSVLLRVNDGTVDTDQSFTITVNAAPDPYMQWKSDNNVTDDNADDDSDGISNIMEYALGGDPKSSESGQRPTVSPSGANIDFNFRRNEASVTYIIEKSSDLSTWVEHLRIIDDSYGAVGTDCNVPVSLSGISNGKLFLRLKIEN